MLINSHCITLSIQTNIGSMLRPIKMIKISSKSPDHHLRTAHTTRIHIKLEDSCLHNKVLYQINRSLGAVQDWVWVLEISHLHPLINSNYLEIMVNRILIQQVSIQNLSGLIMVLEDWQLTTISWLTVTETIPQVLLTILFNSSSSLTWVSNLPSPSLTQAELSLKKIVEEGWRHLWTSSWQNKIKKSYNRS